MKDYSQRASEVLKRIDDKMVYGVMQARKCDYIPYTASDGMWSPSKIGWWTNGFWPASMWQMYLETGKELYREEAVRAERIMDEALRDYKDLHHDLGFMWLINSGVHYALENDSESRDRLNFAGHMLASRFNPNGFIRAWHDQGDVNRAGWSIIDTMMNLPLLYTMSEMNNDPRFALMAKAHADKASVNFYKEDGSVYHIVIYNPEDMTVLETTAGQGYAPGSSWSRGQSWAIYGFMLSYLYTGNKRYLETARRTADYFIKHTPENGLAPVDFCQPAEPRLIDNCANGIAACGLIELAKAISDTEADAADEYRDFAAKLLFALTDNCADWTDASPAVLTSCTGAYHDKKHHIPMVYGDYFLIEGLRKLTGETRLFWKPLDFARKA